MLRSGPVSPPSLDQAQGKASAEPSSSNSDDTTSQDRDITSSILSSQESLKRKNPDDGFDEDNVRIFFSVTFLLLFYGN